MKKILENGRTIGKRKRERFLTWSEMLQLPYEDLIPTIKSQGRPTITQSKLLDKANRHLYVKAKGDYIQKRISTFLNNLTYVKNKFKLTSEIMDDYMIKFSTIDKPIRFNNFSLSTGLRNLTDVFEYAFAYGYAFNVSTDILLFGNLEYLDSINCVDGFQYYLGNPTDLDLPIVVNNTAVFKKDLMRKIGKEKRTGIKQR